MRHVHPVPVEVVADQISLLLESFPVAAIKTGMLFSAAHVRAVAKLLSSRPGIRLVVDPVMVASTGDPLLEDDAVAAYRTDLLPLARVITPNLPEAEVLLGRAITGPDLADSAKELAQILGTAVLLIVVAPFIGVAHVASAGLPLVIARSRMSPLAPPVRKILWP